MVPYCRCKWMISRSNLCWNFQLWYFRYFLAIILLYIYYSLVCEVDTSSRSKIVDVGWPWRTASRPPIVPPMIVKIPSITCLTWGTVGDSWPIHEWTHCFSCHWRGCQVCRENVVNKSNRELWCQRVYLDEAGISPPPFPEPSSGTII